MSTEAEMQPYHMTRLAPLIVNKASSKYQSGSTSKLSAPLVCQQTQVQADIIYAVRESTTDSVLEFRAPTSDSCLLHNFGWRAPASTTAEADSGPRELDLDRKGTTASGAARNRV